MLRALNGGTYELVSENLTNAEIKNESEYVNALKSIGFAELPTKVEFYANDFDSKEAIKQYIEKQNI